MGAADYAAVLGVWLVAIAAPGPDVVLVLRQTVRGGRSAGVAAALGIALGIVAWIALAMAGAHVLVEADDRVLGGLQILGGGYLVLLGAQGLRAALTPGGAHEFELSELSPQVDPSEHPGSAPRTSADERRSLSRRSFGLGLLTNLSNPKALVFFGAVFTLLVPEDTRAGDRVALSILLVATAAIWFAGLAMLTSSAKVGAFLGRHAARLDTIAAVAFMVLGGVSLASGVAAMV